MGGYDLALGILVGWAHRQVIVARVKKLPGGTPSTHPSDLKVKTTFPYLPKNLKGRGLGSFLTRAVIVSFCSVVSSFFSTVSAEIFCLEYL